TITKTGGTYYQNNYFCYSSANSQVNDNTITTNNTAGYYTYNYLTYTSDNATFDGNTLTNTNTGTSTTAYVYNMVGYSCANFSIRDNKISSTNVGGALYGAYIYNSGKNGGVVANNDIRCVSTSGSVYG